MSIIDTFPYFNEKELLELRINLLNDHIDKFLIIDANRTHKGENKPFTCKDTLKDLGLFTDKTQVIELDLPSYIEEPNPWVRERIQRNAAAKFISENDIAIVSDCDEIIDPNYIEYYIDIAKKHPNNILRIPMVLLNCRGDLIVCDENNNERICTSPFFCLKHHLNEYTLSDIRESNAYGKNNIKHKDIFTTENSIIDKAGWHFSWMGDENRLKNKYESFAHGHEVNLIDNYIPKENSTDPLGRKDYILKKYDIVNLPSKIFELPIVAKFLQLQSDVSIVQIGANRANDELSNYVKLHYKNIKFGLFVEPMVKYTEEIKTCYNYNNEIIVENICIVPNSYGYDNITMYYHTGDPTLGVMSSILDHVIKHTPFFNDGHIESFKVPCLTLDKLFDKYNITNLDMLFIDIEGMDGDVLLSIDLSKYNINKIEFEFIHLSVEILDKITNKLLSNGYRRTKTISELNLAFIK